MKPINKRTKTSHYSSSSSTSQPEDEYETCDIVSGVLTSYKCNQGFYAQANTQSNGKKCPAANKSQEAVADLNSKIHEIESSMFIVALEKRPTSPAEASQKYVIKHHVPTSRPDQTTAVDIWDVGVIFMSILSSVYTFFKAPDDYVTLAEMVTIFGDKAIRKTAFVLGRIVTISHWTKPVDLPKLCVRLRNHRRTGFTAELKDKYTTIMQGTGSNMEVCKNCEQLFYDCLCKESSFNGEEILEKDIFPASAYNLLYKLLELNPHKRISAQEALEHPFFEEAICETAVTSNLAV